MAGEMMELFPEDEESGHRCFHCGRYISCEELFLNIQKMVTVRENGLKRDVVQVHAGDQLSVDLCLECAGTYLYDLVKGGDDPF